MLLCDAETVRGVMLHPGVLRWVAPAGFDIASFEPSKSRIYLDFGRGFASFGKWSQDYWDIHVAMLPKSPPVAKLMLNALAWMVERHGAKGFIANIPAINFPARRLARVCGFDECGRVRDAVEIGGIRSDVVIYERPECLKS